MNEIRMRGSELGAILAEYAFDPDIMNNESRKVRLAKRGLEMLPDADRIIFCMYLDRGSSREVGKILGCSHCTVLKQLNRIKEEILEKIKSIENEEDDDN